MKVFLCWSGQRSHDMAEALSSWLRLVIQAVEPWISSSDIEKGRRWALELADLLEEVKVGIICLTPEHLDSTWIHFEAGALSKLKGDRVCTLLLGGMKYTDIKDPLAQFQHTVAVESDIRKLVDTINRALKDAGEREVAETVLDASFKQWWPKLRDTLAEIAEREKGTQPPPRPDREILEEILTSVRGLERIREPRRSRYSESSTIPVRYRLLVQRTETKEDRATLNFLVHRYLEGERAARSTLEALVRDPKRVKNARTIHEAYKERYDYEAYLSDQVEEYLAENQTQPEEPAPVCEE